MYWLARRGGTPWAKLGGALPGEEKQGCFDLRARITKFLSKFSDTFVQFYCPCSVSKQI